MMVILIDYFFSKMERKNKVAQALTLKWKDLDWTFDILLQTSVHANLSDFKKRLSKNEYFYWRPALQNNY